MSSPAAKAAISQRLLWLMDASTLTFKCKLHSIWFTLSEICYSLGKDHKMQGVPSLVTTVWFSLYLSVVVAFFVFVSLFRCFWFLTFVESKYYSLNSAALNSGLSFKSIKRVDCDGGVREEPHKVRIKIKKCRFLLLASEMRITLSGKHGKANCSIYNWRWLFCKSISLWTIMNSKYYLIFLVRLYLIFSSSIGN